MMTTSHEHGRPAEIKPDRTICTQWVKMGYILADSILYSNARAIQAIIMIVKLLELDRSS